MFRAIEYKYLLFFYLRYALNNLIERKYIDHFELLSASIYMLCKEEVSDKDIEIADKMLNEFCDLFVVYFGKHAVTMNIYIYYYVTMLLL